MLLRNSPRPASSHYIFEWLRLTNTCRWVAENSLDQIKGADCYFAICFNPIEEILAKFGMENRFAVNASRQAPSPGEAFQAVPVSLFAAPHAAEPSEAFAHSGGIGVDALSP